MQPQPNNTPRYSSTRSWQTPPWSWVRYASYWASYSAHEASCSLWQRIAGWLLLGAFAVVLLALTGFAVIAIGAGLDTIRTGGIIIIAIGLLLLSIPLSVMLTFVHRRRREGSAHTSFDDLQQMRQEQAAWQLRESQKSIRDKVFSTIFIVLVLAGWWAWRLHHARHSSPDFITPGMWTIFGAYVIWIQFLKPRNSRP